MMSIKRDIHEFCPKCGAKDAELRGNMVAWGLHKCSKAPSGPSTTPRFSSLNDVSFIPRVLDIPLHLRNKDNLIDELQQQLAAETARADKLQAALDGMKPVSHMFPSDLARFEEAETFAQSYSVEVGNPYERSVALYLKPEVK